MPTDIYYIFFATEVAFLLMLIMFAVFFRKNIAGSKKREIHATADCSWMECFPEAIILANYLDDEIYPVAMNRAAQRFIASIKNNNQCIGQKLCSLKSVLLSVLNTTDSNTQSDILLNYPLAKIITTGSENSPEFKNKTFSLCIDEIPMGIIGAGDGAPSLIIRLKDITAIQQQITHKAQDLKREALSDFASGVSHDFNNVLSIMTGYAKMIADRMKADSFDPIKISEYAEKILKACDRGAGLTRKLQIFSKFRSHNKEVFDLAQLIQAQTEYISASLGNKIRFNSNISSNTALPIEGSKDSIEQILRNIIKNAVDAMPEGGTLSLGVSMDKTRPNYTVLSFRDTGHGIEDHVMPRIFDPFFTTRERGQATGLGLSVVMGLVRELGGEISVTSNPSFHSGTEVRIFIPLSEKEIPQKAINYEEDKQDVNLSGSTVLLVDDEPELLEWMGAMLEQEGLRVLKALSGDHALAVQDTYMGHIDILITDILMPGMDGVRFAKLFDSLRPNVPVVFISGYPAAVQTGEYDLPEGSHFLSKPVAYEMLKHALASGLRGAKVKKYADWQSNQMWGAVQ